MPELLREPGTLVEGGEQRADLLYVSATKKGGLRLAFVEVKFRRYLKTARSPDLAEGMERQIAASCQRWGQLFGTRTSALEKTVNRAWLARILRFYARKGRRHGLSEEAFNTAMREIDRVVRKDAELPDHLEIKRVGFVFCPEYGGHQPARIEHGGEADLWLFGPDILPEPRAASMDDGEGSDAQAERGICSVRNVSDAPDTLSRGVFPESSNARDGVANPVPPDGTRVRDEVSVLVRATGRHSSSPTRSDSRGSPRLRPDGACAPCVTFRMPRIP